MDRQRPQSTAVDMWTFRESTLDPTSLTGYSVEASDGGIGKIDEATGEAGRSQLIVDTGPWIFGKKVLLPAGVIERVDPDTETVYVSLLEGRDQERTGVRSGSSAATTTSTAVESAVTTSASDPRPSQRCRWAQRPWPLLI